METELSTKYVECFSVFPTVWNVFALKNGLYREQTASNANHLSVFFFKEKAPENLAELITLQSFSRKKIFDWIWKLNTNKYRRMHALYFVIISWHLALKKSQVEPVRSEIKPSGIEFCSNKLDILETLWFYFTVSFFVSFAWE